MNIISRRDRRRGLIIIAPKPKYNLRNIDLDVILSDVAFRLKISPEDLKSKIRTRKLVDARCIYALRARRLTHKSCKEIGNLINRDHSTIVHYIKESRDVIELKKLYNEIYG